MTKLRLALVVVPLLLAFQCDTDSAVGGADAGRVGPDAGGAAPDAGPMTPDDGVLGVPAADVDTAEVPGGFSPPDAEALAELDARAACYDEGADGGACEEAACRNLGACCVGRGDCCAPTALPELPPAIDFTGCADPSCLGTAWHVFGLGVEASADGLTPRGTAFGDGGVALLAPLPLHSTRATFEVTLRPPTDCAGGCLETLSFGVLASLPGAGAGVAIQPTVALTYAGEQDELALVLSGSERLRIPRGATSNVALTLEPTGRVIVVRGGERFVVDDAFVPRPLHLAIWGRSRNPGASDRRSVAASTLTSAVELCDMPQAWDTRVAIEGVEGSAPSLATDGADTWLAYVGADGSIHLAQQEVGGRFTPLPAHLAPENVPFAGDLDDPELVFHDGQWQLYFTGRGSDSTHVGRARLQGDTFTVDTEPVLRDAWAPTVAASLGGQLVMIAQSDEGPRSYVEVDGAMVELFGSRLGDAVASLLGVVGPPSLVVHDRAWHLYVPVRRGTRWSVELFASEEALVWRHVGPTLLASGEGFDRLGVRSPDALSRGDRVELAYEGDDGVQQRLGWATRQGTSGGRR